MPKKVLSFDTLGLADVSAVIQDWGGPVSSAPNIRQVGGSTPVFIGSRMDPRKFVVHIDLSSIGNAATRRARMQSILGIIFDERGLDQEHRLIALMDDGVTTVYRDVTVAGRPAIGEGYINVEMHAARPGWYSLFTKTDTGEFINPGGAMEILSEDKATGYPVYRIRWTAQRSTSSGDVGYQYEQVWRIANNETSAMRHECIMITLGDTRSLVTGGKAKSDGNDVKVWHHGKELARDLINWNTIYTQLWVTIPEIMPGKYQDISVVYGNPTATTPKRLNAGTTEPAFSILGTNSSLNTINSSIHNGFTDRLYVNTGATPFYTDMWRSGRLRIYNSSGVQQGSDYLIVGNGVNYFEISGTFSPVVAATNWLYIVYMSDNTRHGYHVQRTNRSSWTHGGKNFNPRGGWWLDQGYRRARRVRFADFVPGAWSRVLTQRNEDRYAQPRFSYLDDGTGDKDSFAIFDATRAVSDARRRPEDGQYDGVMISSVHGFDYIYYNTYFLNPIRTSSTPTQGIAKYKVLAQGAEGGEDWDVIFETGTANEAPTIAAAATATMSSIIGYNPNHIAFAVWGRDIDNNDARVTETVSKKKVAYARWGNSLALGINTSNWSVTRIVSERSAYDVNATLRLNGGSVGPFAPYDALIVGGTGRRFMLNTGEIFAYDTRTGLAEVRAEDDDDFIEAIPFAAMPYRYEQSVDGLSVVRGLARTAMTLNVDFNGVVNGSFSENVTGWSSLFQEPGSSISFSWNPGEFGRAVVTVNPSSLNQVIWMFYTPASPFPVSPRRRYRLNAKLRSSVTGLTPFLGIAFDNNTVGVPNFPFPPTDDWSIPLANTWYQHQVQVRAPSNARYAYPVIGIIERTAGATGNVDFDTVDMADVLHVSEPAMGTLEVSVEYEEGWIE